MQNNGHIPNQMLIDTGWILCNVDTSAFSNYTWEPLAYRRIGDVVYVHGGGKILTMSTITTLPKPRQINCFPCSVPGSRADTINMVVDNDGTFKKSGRTTEQIEIIINFSYITRD